MPRSLHAPVARFRVTPSKASRLHVQVLVFATYKAMYGYKGGGHGRDYRGITLFTGVAGRCICEVHFCAEALYPSLIAHEMTHAALGYLTRIRRANLDVPDTGDPCLPYDHPEEVLCRAVQRFVSTTLIQLELAGLPAAEPSQPAR